MCENYHSHCSWRLCNDFHDISARGNVREVSMSTLQLFGQSVVMHVHVKKRKTDVRKKKKRHYAKSGVINHAGSVWHIGVRNVRWSESHHPHADVFLFCSCRACRGTGRRRNHSSTYHLNVFLTIYADVGCPTLTTDQRKWNKGYLIQFMSVTAVGFSFTESEVTHNFLMCGIC